MAHEKGKISEENGNLDEKYDWSIDYSGNR